MKNHSERKRRTNDEENGHFPSGESPFRRLLEETYWDLLPALEPAPAKTFVPLIDVFETADEVIVEADVPNFTPQNIRIDVMENVLLISGKRTDLRRARKMWHQRERSYRESEFLRYILLPPYADITEADCTIRHGTLTITIPKSEDASEFREENI